MKNTRYPNCLPNPGFWPKAASLSRIPPYQSLLSSEIPYIQRTVRGRGPSSWRAAIQSRSLSTIGLIKQLAAWPRLVEAAAEAHEPHRIAFYLYDLAAAFHGLWTKGKDEAHLRFLLPQEPELTKARLALVQAVAFVVASGLETFGVEPVEEMR